MLKLLLLLYSSISIAETYSLLSSLPREEVERTEKERVYTTYILQRKRKREEESLYSRRRRISLLSLYFSQRIDYFSSLLLRKKNTLFEQSESIESRLLRWNTLLYDSSVSFLFFKIQNAFFSFLCLLRKTKLF